MITEVEPGGPAAEAGLQTGQLIVSVDRNAVHTVREFQKAVGEAEKVGKVLLLVKSSDGSRFVLLKK